MLFPLAKRKIQNAKREWEWLIAIERFEQGCNLVPTKSLGSQRNSDGSVT